MDECQRIKLFVGTCLVSMSTNSIPIGVLANIFEYLGEVKCASTNGFKVRLSVNPLRSGLLQAPIAILGVIGPAGQPDIKT